MTVNIPVKLLSTSPLAELTKKQTNEFLNRLDFIVEIPSRFRKGVDNGKDTRELLDDLELDVAVNLAMPSENQNELTAYFIHTSWADCSDAGKIQGLLGDEIRQELFRNSTAPSDSHSFQLLVEREFESMEKLAGLIDNATTFDGLLAALIGIDCVLSRLLHISCMMRLLDIGR